MLSTGSAIVSEGLEERVADLCEMAVSIWQGGPGAGGAGGEAQGKGRLDEAPTRAWLNTYLGNEALSGVYQVGPGAGRGRWAVRPCLLAVDPLIRTPRTMASVKASA